MSHLRRLLALLLLVPSLGAAAETRQVAVVISKQNPSFLQAIEGMRRISGVIPNVFELEKGTTEVDRALDALRRFPFDAVLALGLPAHEFCLKVGHKRPYRAALLADAAADHPAVFDLRPTVRDWARVFERVLPPGSVVAAFAASAPELRRLEEMARRVEETGRLLVIGRLGPGRSPPKVVRQTLERRRARAVFLPEDWQTARQPGTLKHLLQRAHAGGVPVFTEAMARKFAVLSLHVPNETTGEMAVRDCLGLPTPEGLSGVEVNFNPKRARDLKITIPPEVMDGSILRTGSQEP